MTVRKGISGGGSTQRADFWTKCPEVASGHNGPKLGERANAGNPFGENGNGEQTEGHMIENPYKRLPPLERKPDGTPYRMTPAQRKQANVLIRRECCNCEDGNCIVLDDGDACACPQIVSFSVCCKWFRWAVLPLAVTLEAEIYRGRDLKRCAVCGGVFVPKSNRAKYCPGCAARVHRRQKTESERKRRSAVDS